MATTAQKLRIRKFLLFPTLLLLTAGYALASADAEGVVVNTEGKAFKGNVRYKALNKVYIVTSGASGGPQITMEVPLVQVKSVTVAEPPDFRGAVKMLQENKLAQAIAVLDKISQEYSMLQWDVPATRWLAEGHLRDGKPDQAVRACERITDKRTEAAISGELAPVYWQALLAAGRNNKLEELLIQAAKSPIIDGQARANVMRGEVLRKQNRPKDALRDGYLRTIVLFRGWTDPSVREARAEALYKAAQCFDDLGIIAPATKMRNFCMTDHADSVWAQRLKAGETR